ncbi:LuxR C-terminal-related transcriptional regulator [Lysobacter rhizosphaerae]
MSESEFALKATPPRMPRTALERERLQRFWADVHDRTAIAVVAPAGFGKTTLLLQWRRRWLEQGARVAWLTAGTQDDPVRFAEAVCQAIRDANRRPTQAVANRVGKTGMEALTALLSEVAQQGGQTVLMLDDAERLPLPTLRGAVQYLLFNAPANLHLVFGSRVPLALPVAELAAKGNYATLATDALRLRMEESIELLEKRLPQLSVDARAHLHETTEGWPLGLQLAIAAIEHAPDPVAALESLSARHGTIQDYFVESLLAQLSPALTEFLPRIAILDRMNAELCAAVTGVEDSAEVLDQLVAETPIMIQGERTDWIRLHPLARDFLLARFERLPMAEQATLHMRAASWFAGKERFHEAAGHALAAGDHALAQSHAARSLWTLGISGKYAEAREWLGRIPPEVLAGDLDLRLAAAWILALGDRNAAALEIAREVIDDPAAPSATLAVALRVAAGAAAYADQLGLLPDFVARWPGLHECGGEPLHAVTHLNFRALVALHEGATGDARALVAQAARFGNSGSLRLSAQVGLMLVGLSHLWEGDACQAEAVIQPALAQAEREGQRRGMAAALLASVLAAALFGRDQPAAAQAVLANRLDVIERSGFPDNVLLAYRTLANVALSQHDERRALNVLGNLEDVAERRQLPRLRAYALADQIRIHALRGRNETVATLLAALEQLAPAFEHEQLHPLALEYQLIASLARTHAALAKRELDEAESEVAAVGRLAAQLNRGRDALTVKVLRAVIARQRGSVDALPLLQEVLELAEISGYARLLIDTHPLAVEMAAELHPASSGETPPPAPTPIRAAPPRHGLLTSKEAQILSLIEKGMSNKEIARTLDISGETVKWHLKNLFLKLSAGNRKHAVDRARLLGLTH